MSSVTEAGWNRTVKTDDGMITAIQVCGTQQDSVAYSHRYSLLVVPTAVYPGGYWARDQSRCSPRISVEDDDLLRFNAETLKTGKLIKSPMSY